MTLATRARQQYADGTATSPTIDAPSTEGTISFRLPDSDWGSRTGNIIIEKSLDNGQTWEQEARVGGVTLNPGDPFYLESTSSAPRGRNVQFRGRLDSRSPVSTALELESR